MSNRGRRAVAVQQAAQARRRWMAFGISIVVVALISLMLWAFVIRPKISNNEEAGTRVMNLSPVGPPVEVTRGPKMTADDRAGIARRSIVRDGVVAEATNIAKSTGDVEAMQVAKFLRAGSVIVSPDPRGFRILEKIRQKPFFFISIPMPGDAPIGSNSESAGAEYDPPTNLMLLRHPEQFTSRWYAVCALHEGKHAYEINYRAYDWQNAHVFCSAERDAHEFQNRIVAKLGGTAYLQIRDTEVLRLVSKMRRDGIKFGTGVPGRGEYDTRLDSVFGLARSSYERDMRQTHLWIDAAFTLIDRHASGNREELKAKMLSSVYRKEAVGPYSHR